MATPVDIPLVKGFRDLLPADAAVHARLESEAARAFGRYGFDEIRLPVLERSDLFARSLGDTTDVVEKEMFAFDDRDGTGVALRPEATASTVRAYLSAGPGAQGGIARYWYAGPMFRRERPQKGRFRQFGQIGVEAFGEAGPGTDAEIIVMLMDYLATCGIDDVTLLLGSLGDADCRPAYRDALRAFAEARRDQLCATCQDRLERNPLRILDCKSSDCQATLEDAPLLIENLCAACDAHLATVRRLLAAAGVSYELAPRLVRGLDYYTRTAFEVTAAGLGSQNAIGGGGRYDGLVEQLGGPSVPAFGFALGTDRLAMVAPVRDEVERSGVAVLTLTDAALETALGFATRLRRAGWRVMVEEPGRSLKSLLKAADRRGARVAIMFGDDELAAETVTVRDLQERVDHKAAFSTAVTGDEFGEWMRVTTATEGDG